jgi:pyruvate,orthophosphate dikinase
MAVTAQKWVYAFEESEGLRKDALGGKGAGLAEMSRAGLPVPPGFTITTEACRAFYGQFGGVLPDELWEQVQAALASMETRTGKRFGDHGNPLLVAVRSGAKFSMPGMMDTILNLGLNDETVRGLAAQTSNERFAFDSYRRFVQMFGKVVLHVDAERFEEAISELKRSKGVELDTELDAADLRGLVATFVEIVETHSGRAFPQEPHEQLRLAVEAVFGSWNGDRAVAYRELMHIPHDLGTAVNIVAMVFGNLGEDSGSGVAFTRDPSTGERRLFGEYLSNAQGEDVVSGARTPKAIAELEHDYPEAYRQLAEIAERLERHYRDVQDTEFTVERGKLYMLQTRSAKRTAQAAVRAAVDMVGEGLISREEAIGRVPAAELSQLLVPQFDPAALAAARSAGRLLGKGLNASPGAATGKAVFTADRAKELGEGGEAVILVRPETNPDDVHGMIAARGILTARGGATSHAAVVARGLGKPCVAGVESLLVEPRLRRMRAGGRVVREGEEISIDGATGEVYTGSVATTERGLGDQPELRTLLGWADGVRRLGVWANADYPRDARVALEYGAEGIGLARTEHMFFEQERLPVVRQMILNAGEATALGRRVAAAEKALGDAPPDRREELERELREAQSEALLSDAFGLYHGALEHLGEVQRCDFRGLLEVMQGKSVIVRLIDPPLHEFLPPREDLERRVEELRHADPEGEELHEVERELHVVESLHEQNPMLGLRGVRLSILYPDIVRMQVGALIAAACELAAEGKDVRPEIMVPLVGHPNELKVVRGDLERAADETQARHGVRVAYKVGTMIELPRACLVAGEIAKDAEFFSFGTNDLTQTVYGLSRDDAESKFLLEYVDRKVLPENPFQTLDRDGVGRLMRVAVEEGRAARPELEVGICGEHGGDPASVAFCHELGLHYVSASPYRIPVARLAAAQAALGEAERDK